MNHVVIGVLSTNLAIVNGDPAMYVLPHLGLWLSAVAKLWLVPCLPFVGNLRRDLQTCCSLRVWRTESAVWFSWKPSPILPLVGGKKPFPSEWFIIVLTCLKHINVKKILGDLKWMITLLNSRITSYEPLTNSDKPPSRQLNWWSPQIIHQGFWIPGWHRVQCCLNWK